MAPCSKRMAITKRFQHEKSFRKSGEGKVLCHYMLEKMFSKVYQSVRLQLDLEEWASKLDEKTF